MSTSGVERPIPLPCFSLTNFTSFTFSRKPITPIPPRDNNPILLDQKFICSHSKDYLFSTPPHLCHADANEKIQFFPERSNVHV